MPVERGFSKLLAADLRNVYLMGIKRTSRNDWVLIGPTKVIHTSERALKVHVEGTPLWMDEWVPKSQLHKEENECWQLGDEGMLVIPEWLAKEKGWLK